MASHRVELHLYDVSKGVFKHIAHAIFGTELEGLWHSGIVVNGTEYQFGPNGLWRSFPQQSAFGTPNQVTVLGQTSLAGDDLEDAIRGLVANRYNEDKYDILFNNANHFANDLSLTLTGSPLPDFVLNQIQDILATPTGEALFNLLPPFLFPNGHPFTRSNPTAPADPSAPSTSQAPSAAAATDAAMDDDNDTSEDACPADHGFPEFEGFQDVAQLIQDAMHNVFAAGSAACAFAGPPGPFGFPPHGPHGGFGGPQGFGPPGLGPHGHGPHGCGFGPHGHSPHGHGPRGHGHSPHSFRPHGHGPHGHGYPDGFGGFSLGGPSAFGGFSGFGPGGPGAFGFGGPFSGLAGAARAMATQGGACMKRRGPCGMGGVGVGGGRGGRGCGAWRGRGAGCRMGMGRGAGCCEAREEARAAAAADATQASPATASPSAPAALVDPAAPSTSQQAVAATRVAADLAQVSVSTATDEQQAGAPVPVDWTAGDAQAAAAAQWDMLGMEEVAGARKLE